MSNNFSSSWIGCFKRFSRNRINELIVDENLKQDQHIKRDFTMFFEYFFFQLVATMAFD